ncbi:hypothetical protein IR083_20795 [Dysgonomonas sp. GY75]|uniref:hypothetical protein n=1 Tax=Dysgonomonas sp. GY75 TaxID=2780419 RepID=UPI0018838A61|nr:hypothetical protein [Dysgonomonas sp. GY75]MBF0651260.1 hypothetical protein [Dysgonomonas sp. GY75]
MKPKKPKYEDFKTVCSANGGIISGIAAYFGVERKTIYRWCDADEKFKEALEDSRENFLDLAENRLQTLVKGIPEFGENENGHRVQVGWKVPPDNASVFFVLKTKGKKRGYCERQDINMNANVSMEGHIDIDQWIKDKSKK